VAGSSRRGLVIGGVVALVLVLAVGGFAAWYFLADDAPPPPKLEDAASTGAAGGSPDGEWVLGTGGFVGYRVEEKFGGETLSKTAVGRTSDISGTMTIAGNRIDSAKVTANLKELTSDREPRDTYLYENALETNTYPTAEFALDAPVALPSPVPSGKVVEVPVTGKLTLHGQTQPVTATLEGRWTGNRIDVAGRIPVQFATFGIPTPDSAIVETEDHGDIELKLVFARS
jgi:polyisoprenoid-binding protein YceI